MKTLHGLLIVLVMTALAFAVKAEDLEVQTLRAPTPSDAQLLGTHSTRQGPSHSLSLGLSLSYLNDPLVLTDGSDKRVASLVSDQLSAELAAAYALTGRIELGAALPLILYQDTASRGGIRIDDTSVGLGDARLIARVRLLGDARSGFSLGARGDLSLPTSVGADFAGQPTVGFSPTLVAELRSRLVLLSGNVGGRIRKRASVGDLDVGSAGQYALGVAVRLGRLPLHALGEGAGEVAGGGISKNPFELRGGARWDANEHLTVLAGYGRGIVGGYGSPDHRLLLTMAYRFVPAEKPAQPPKPPARRASPAANPDPDGDGILGADDTCPADPEDFDGFDDRDGCPELDNDHDGIADASDACRNHAEDVDRHEDQDGCPDPDNDSDGILDAKDRCPDQAEIINGNEDDDGCPDEGRQLVVVGAAKIAIAEKLFFANNQDVILARSEPVLAQLATTLQRMVWLRKVRIEGHTDERGTPQLNKELSQRRADSVRKALIERGVAAERLESVGYGEEQPIDSNKTLEGRANNRRVEFVITSQDAPPAGFKAPADAKLLEQPASTKSGQGTKEVP